MDVNAHGIEHYAAVPDGSICDRETAELIARLGIGLAVDGTVLLRALDVKSSLPAFILALVNVIAPF